MKKQTGWQQFQYRILHNLKSRLGGHNFAKWLAETLDISLNAAYKKINTESQLNMEDLMKLYLSIPFSIDEALASKNSAIPFMSDAVRRIPEKPSEYFINLANHLRYIKDLKGLNYLYLANELPIFHYLCFPELIYFKIFVWNYTVWQQDYGSKNLHFDPESMRKDKELNESMQLCKDIYYTFPGVEIWNSRMFDIILDQIKFFVQLRSFKSKNDITLLLDEIFKLLQHLEKMAETAKKPGAAKETQPGIRIYNNDLVSTCETILVNSNAENFLFISIDHPNIIRTQDKRMTDYTNRWFKQTLRHCNLISGEGERERQEILQTYRMHFERAEIEIQALIKYKSYS